MNPLQLFPLEKRAVLVVRTHTKNQIEKPGVRVLLAVHEAF
jgi:hypothetical protein